jgi:TonB family protein
MGLGRIDVSDVLRSRRRESGGPARTGALVVSILLHGALLTGLLLAPPGLLTHKTIRPRSIMTITLGGGSGPRAAGLTSIGGRPVQVETPPDAGAVREAVRSPAAKAPEMTLPTAGKARRATAPAVKQVPDEARGTTPTKGVEAQPGSTVAETGARGQGFGLSTGGGAGSGSTLDVADFCCPDYLVLMVERIRSSWEQQAEVAGSVIIQFTIGRDGRIVQPIVERSSGYATLDLQARRAVVVTQQLPPLPAAFPNPTLTVHLNFQYQR